MTSHARISIWATLALAALSSILALLFTPIDIKGEWVPLAGLVGLATLAQLFRVEVPGRQPYYPHVVFFLAGVLLLPAGLFIPLVILPHLAEWATERIKGGPMFKMWYTQPYNASSHLLAGFTAYLAYNITGAEHLSSYTPLSVLAVLLAVVAYVAVNHVLMGMAPVIARGLTWRGTGVLELDSLLPDLVLAGLGYIVAVLFSASPWLALPALLPLAMIQHLFRLFRLKRDDLTDGATGLWSITHFNAILEGEMERARRFGRDLSVLVAELDAPADIESVYGKAAVDIVFLGLGAGIHNSLRQYDAAARLEGYRVAVLIPEANPFEALIVAKRLRSVIEEASFRVTSSDIPVRATMSIGIAGFPGDGTKPGELLSAATEAMIYAAARGRGNIVSISDVPRSMPEVALGNLKLKGEIFTPSSEKQTAAAGINLRKPEAR